MTQQEIKELREDIEQDLFDAKTMLKVAEAKLLALTDYCKHPNGKREGLGEYTKMFKCADCGYKVSVICQLP